MFSCSFTHSSPQSEVEVIDNALEKNFPNAPLIVRHCALVIISAEGDVQGPNCKFNLFENIFKSIGESVGIEPKAKNFGHMQPSVSTLL